MVVGLVLLRARSEWRRHFWTFVALTLLIGLVGSVVLTAVSGARRTRNSVERLDRTTRGFDAFIVFADGESKAGEAIAALPEVETAGRFSPMSLFNEQGYLPIVASIDGHIGDTLQRDRVMRGRRPNPRSALEIGLSEPLARHLRLEVGGRLPLTGISKEQSACVFGESTQGDPRCAAFQKSFYANPPDFSSFAGPRVTLRVVGITRGLGDIAARPGDLGLLFLTPAFYRAYHDDVATQPGMAVRFRSGATPEEFEAAVARVVRPGAIRDSSEITPVIDGLQSTVGVLANGLLAFAAAAGLAGFAAMTQAFARRAAALADEEAVLHSMGMTRGQLTLDSFAPLVPVAVAGALLSAIGGWLASPLMPIGTARRVEPHPGVHFDAAVLLGGGALIAVGAVGVAALSGLWVARRSERRAVRVRVTRGWMFRSVPATIGGRLALDNGRGRRGIPLRSAVSGVVLGVAGVVAVTTFGAGLTRLGHEPSRYGWAWDVAVSGERASDPDTPQPQPKAGSTYWDRQAARLVADRDVASVTHVWLGYQARVAGRTVKAFAERRYSGSTGFAIIAGRAPAGSSEVADRKSVV